MVEFALVFPILCVFLLGMIDASRMMISRAMLSYAVVAGARLAVAQQNSAGTTTTVAMVQSATLAAAPLLSLASGSVYVCINQGASTCSSTPSTAAWAARTTGDTVTVAYGYAGGTGYTFTPMTGSLAKLITKTFRASSMQTIP